jgi:hypothetical protein
LRTPHVGLCSLSHPHLSEGLIPKPIAPCSAPAGTHRVNLAGPHRAKPLPGTRPMHPPTRHSEHASADSMLVSLPWRCPGSASACCCTTANPGSRHLPMSRLPPLRPRAGFPATPTESCPGQAPRDKCLCLAHSSPLQACHHHCRRCAHCEDRTSGLPATARRQALSSFTAVAAAAGRPCAAAMRARVHTPRCQHRTKH